MAEAIGGMLKLYLDSTPPKRGTFASTYVSLVADGVGTSYGLKEKGEYAGRGLRTKMAHVTSFCGVIDARYASLVLSDWCYTVSPLNTYRVSSGYDSRDSTLSLQCPFSKSHAHIP